MSIQPTLILRSTLALGVLFLGLLAIACGGAAPPAAVAPAPTEPPPTAIAPATSPPQIAAATLAGTAPDASLLDASLVDASLIDAGRALFAGGGGCSACHSIAGVGQGVLGPDQTHVGTWAASRIAGYTAEQYIRESIVEPCAYSVGPGDEGIDAEYQCTLMEATLDGIALSDADVDALVAFMLAQK